MGGFILKKKFLQSEIYWTVVILFIGATLVPTAITSMNNSSTDSCDIPTWQTGDEWIYTADPVTYYSEDGAFDGVIENFKHEVVGITTITHGGDEIEVYQVDLSGEISGELTWEALTGDLEGDVEGVRYFRVSDLAEVETQIISSGIVTILFINRDYELIHKNLFYPPLETYDFPLKLNDEWLVNLNLVTEGSFIIEDLVNEQYYDSEPLYETLQCTSKEIISVPAGDFDCFKVTYSTDTFWYSSDVCNMIKTVVDHGEKDYSFSMDLNLESYSISSQEIDISENLDPSEAIIDQEVIISGQAVDSDGDPIQNSVVIIKIPKIGVIWNTNTDDNGFYSLSIEAPYMIDDTESNGEFGSNGVIVICSSGNLDGYKVKTLLIIDDFPPEPPSIDGETNGNVGEEYEYEFIALDPDGDDLFYFVEWGDGTNSEWEGPFPAGQKITLSHTWNEKGTFSIRAKVKDESYGAESDWGELVVTMPRNRQLFNSLLKNFLQQHPNLFPILQKLISKMLR
jgi:hypothetical protein